MNLTRWWRARPRAKSIIEAPTPRQYRFGLAINEQRVPRVSVIAPNSVWAAYKDLQSFVLPRYDVFYLMRRKKAFNTLAFQQPYDIFVCDRNFRILAVYPSQAPGYISDYHANAHFIFFATSNSANFYNLKVNDRLQLVRNWLT